MLMKKVIVAVNICVALLFLRIVTAAVNYHERYLTTIEHDNVYITAYFKEIDRRRRLRNKHTLLPLKKVRDVNYELVNEQLGYLNLGKHFYVLKVGTLITDLDRFFLIIFR